jgi:hypothetical protein
MSAKDDQTDYAGRMVTLPVDGFVTPAQRHAGQDQSLMEARGKVYETAAAANPSR